VLPAGLSNSRGVASAPQSGRKRSNSKNSTVSSNVLAPRFFRGKQYSPPEISGMILRKLKPAAAAHLGENVTPAVITVPAYFNSH